MAGAGFKKLGIFAIAKTGRPSRLAIRSVVPTGGISRHPPSRLAALNKGSHAFCRASGITPLSR